MDILLKADARKYVRSAPRANKQQLSPEELEALCLILRERGGLTDHESRVVRIVLDTLRGLKIISQRHREILRQAALRQLTNETMLQIVSVGRKSLREREATAQADRQHYNRKFLRKKRPKSGGGGCSGQTVLRFG